MKNLGVEECLCRYLDTDNEIITLIEFNQYRQKSTSDILNESRILEREYKNLVGAGRNANYLNKLKSKMRVSISRFFLHFPCLFFELLRFFLDFPRESLRNSDPGRNFSVFLSNAYGVLLLPLFFLFFHSFPRTLRPPYRNH